MDGWMDGCRLMERCTWTVTTHLVSFVPAGCRRGCWETVLDNADSSPSISLLLFFLNVKVQSFIVCLQPHYYAEVFTAVFVALPERLLPEKNLNRESFCSPPTHISTSHLLHRCTFAKETLIITWFNTIYFFFLITSEQKVLNQTYAAHEGPTAVQAQWKQTGHNSRAVMSSADDILPNNP